jgi:hypothetical protein
VAAMTFKELLAIVPDQEALVERAAIIQFDSRRSSDGQMSHAEAEAECVRQWIASNGLKRQSKMFK